MVLLGVALSVSQAFAQSVEWPTERAPRPLPAREVKFPPFQVKTLSNGMQVITVAHHEQPAVTMRMLVRAGAAQDPEGKGGLAELVAKLLDQGTTTRSAQQVADQIDSIGGAMGTGSGTDLTFVNAVVMKDSFAVAMDLIHDVVRHPDLSAGRNIAHAGGIRRKIVKLAEGDADGLILAPQDRGVGAGGEARDDRRLQRIGRLKFHRDGARRQGRPVGILIE